VSILSASRAATQQTDDAEHCRWFNRLLGAMWVGWIAPYLNRLLRKAMEPLLLAGGVRHPLLHRLELTALSLGSAAPFVKTVRVYHGGGDDQVRLEIRSVAGLR
jgi:Ca2+-dependent lipid-binding protein